MIYFVYGKGGQVEGGQEDEEEDETIQGIQGPKSF